MPFIDLQSQLGIHLDAWLLLHSAEQPYKRSARCHTFEKDWSECAHGIGQIHTKKQCRRDYEDFNERLHRQKTLQRLYQIHKQREKLVKEGSYMPSAHHSGKPEQ
ncbi:NADH dehydrogenase [ubiquinone] iron-sulfur protein 5 [Lampris incognitus]|uniref:NADH dehydrogenase [ubiquinone] iron-sulfur protein 5 n=1 Tax=Lampris incognitus TaxID=2546036 RepID=UPI0024B55A0C|nr:NADH dehydrogenase [ubiquinone] iron-sulfur protein 5 [Lampris incognitus]